MSRVVINSLLAGLLALGLVGATAGVAGAQETSPIQVTTLYPSVLVDKKDKVTFTINVANNGSEGQSFDLVVADAPENWETLLRSRGFVVRKMYLAAGKSETIDLQLTPPDSVEPQDYSFLLKALGANGAELSALNLIVGVQQAPIGGVDLVTQYPMLQGPSKSTFEFKLDLSNDGDEERNYNLSATAPQGWQVSFKPAFEDKQISSIRMKAGESKGIDVQVKPPEKAPAGDYAVKVQAAGGGQRAEADLKVTLTGTHELTLGTPSGRLNAQATAGQTSAFSVIVGNTGSGELRNISFFSSKPEGWEVKFEPESIDALPAGDAREVNVTLKPSAKAIAGDYMLTLSASAAQASKSVDVRTTVDTSTVWGWLGAGVIVLVIGGLYVIFRAYGRR